MLNKTVAHCKRLATVKMMTVQYPALTESSLRWWIFNEFQNGFHACIRRIGRKVLIDLDDFEAWMDKQKDPAPVINNRSRW